MLLKGTTIMNHLSFILHIHNKLFAYSQNIGPNKVKPLAESKTLVRVLSCSKENIVVKSLTFPLETHPS